MKQEFNISTGKTEEPSNQLLSIRVGEKHFGFSITNSHTGELYKLVWYTSAEMDEKGLNEVYQKHDELRQSFSQTVLCYDHPQSVLVPVTHYRQEDAQLLLQTMFGPALKDQCKQEDVPGWQLQNIYSVPKDVFDWTYENFAGGTYWHTYTVGIRKIEATNFEGSLSVDFRADDFSVIASKGSKLLLAQTYEYFTPADVIYYLLNVCRQFAFSQDTVRVALSGLIDKQSTLYNELYQYFLHVRFREAEWALPPGEQEYPSHFFTSLNDLAQCAS
ncbi:MAG TPA: DUF3822 family protein [Chitinophagaceae bacterium]|nr:DUF3822 family protein [Chitinophagaceae bacterium]